MIRRIIVEGADQQGKTLLCKYLSQKLGWDIVHFGKPADDFNYFTGYITPEKTISDRNFLSEIVYSKIRNSKCKIEDVNLLVNTLKEYGTIVILMDRHNSFVFDKTRHEDYSEFQIAEAMNYYRTEFEKLNIQKYIINPNTICYSSTLNMLVELIKAKNDSI